MRNALIAVAAGALVMTGGCAHAKEKKTGEERLAEMLEGRVAGEPQRCINNYRNADLTIIDKTALVYKVGRTLYVNRTAHPETIDDDDILVIRNLTGSQLCKLDQVTTMDRTSHFYTGSIFLEDFVPYTKAANKEGGN